MANQRRAAWPGEDLCYSCFSTAMRTRGACPICRHDGLTVDSKRRFVLVSNRRDVLQDNAIHHMSDCGQDPSHCYRRKRERREDPHWL